MSRLPAELWLDELAEAAEVGGEVVHAAVTIDLDIDSVVTLDRRRASADRPQGLAIDADRPFAIAGARTTRAVLWSDTAPDTVELRVAAGRLTVWNVWREDGAVHAWIGSAGIRRVELDDHDSDFALRLLASDGLGSDGPDLEIEMRIDGDRGGDAEEE